MSASFAFILTIHNEPEWMVLCCIESIKQHYPDSALVIISDGIARQDSIGQLDEYFDSPHFKAMRCGALWWKRFFANAQSEGADWTVKIDADTLCHRALKFMPVADICGSIGNDGHVQGGAQFFHRSCIEALLAESNDEIWRSPFSWAINEDMANGPLISTDYMLRAMANKLRLTVAWHPETDCHGTNDHPPFRIDAAFTHPHKEEGGRIIHRLTHGEPEGWPCVEMMEQAWAEGKKP